MAQPKITASHIDTGSDPGDIPTNADIVIPDPIDAGTRMFFAQSAAPSGWTQEVDLNDYMLRIVNGTGGASGGTDSPILNDKVPSHTHTGSADSNGNHRHTINFQPIDLAGAVDGSLQITTGSGTTDYTNYDGTHTHNVTVNANTGAADWTPKYLDVIKATKD